MRSGDNREEKSRWNNVLKKVRRYLWPKGIGENKEDLWQKENGKETQQMETSRDSECMPEISWAGFTPELELNYKLLLGDWFCI